MDNNEAVAFAIDLNDFGKGKERQENVKKMSDKQLLEALPEDFAAILSSKPYLLDAFRAYLEGDIEKSKEIIDQRVNEGGVHAAFGTLAELQKDTAFQSDQERFKREGVNLHLSYEMMRKLTYVIEDAHSLILDMEKKADQLVSDEMPIENVLKTIGDRHAGLHELDEEIDKQMAAAYPALAGVSVLPPDATVH